MTTPANIPDDEQGRLEALLSFDVLDTDADNVFDDITRSIADLFEVPMAAISLVDEKRQWLKSKVGLEVDETSRGISFCAHTVLSHDVLVVPDAHQDQRFVKNPLVTEAPFIRSYIGAPLLTEDGHAIGSLCAMDIVSRVYTEKEIKKLKQFARITMSALELYRTYHRDWAVQHLREVAAAERLKNETLLNAMAKAAVVGAWEVDLINQEVTWSGETRRIHNVDDSFQPTVEMGIAFYAPEAQTEITHLFSRCVEHGESFETELPFVAADSERKYVRVIGHPIIENGTIIKAVGAFQDITQERERRDELMKKRREAEAASEAKSNFLATMSHEIRTPLNGVLGMLDLMMTDGLEGQQKERAIVAKQSASALLDLLTDVLDYSKIEAGQLKITNELFNPEHILNRAVNLFRPVAEKKDIQVLLNNKIPRDTRLVGDEGRIGQILMNFISNAIKFTDVGTVKVSAELNGRLGSSPSLRIEVTDTGPGISHEDKSRLFDRFSQIDSTTTRQHEGAGLGLAISRELCVRMDGKIGVVSEPGEGSTFWVEIPTQMKEAASDQPTTKNVKQSESSSGIRVLVVDDNAVNLEVAKAFCMSLGHAVTMVNNGTAAIEMVQKEQFDVILMDVQMPILDGIATMERIRQLSAPMNKIPIIAVTANAMEGDEQSYLSKGFDGYISKPIDVQGLKSGLAEFVGGDNEIALA